MEYKKYWLSLYICIDFKWMHPFMFLYSKIIFDFLNLIWKQFINFQRWEALNLNLLLSFTTVLERPGYSSFAFSGIFFIFDSVLSLNIFDKLHLLCFFNFIILLNIYCSLLIYSSITITITEFYFLSNQPLSSRWTSLYHLSMCHHS